MTVPSQYTSSISPLPDRRSINHSIHNESGLLPSITVKDNDLPLRSSSSSNFTSSSRAQDDSSESVEASVKRSLSDPKSVHPRSRDKRSSKQSKSRPMSMIQTSERDSVSSWVMGDKRNRSGSIPSDISDDSRRSSGIGDSFRSINSDSGAVQGLKASGSYSEMHSVQRLKKRFESGGEYHSDSSSSLASSTQNDNTKPVSRSNSNKRSNPDFTEHQHTIHEEEEHLLTKTRNIHIDSDSDDEMFPDDSSVGDSSRTLHGDGSVKSDSLCMKADSITETLVVKSCEKCSQLNRTDDIGLLTNMNTSEQSCPSTDLSNRVDAGTLCEKAVSSDIGTCTHDEDSFVEVGVQCETHKTIMRSVSSQCGDFVQLSGVCASESDTDNATQQHLKLFYTEDKVDSVNNNASPSLEPVEDSLAHSMPENTLGDLKKSSQMQQGISKSLSDDNISLLREGQAPAGDIRCIHNRSQSDEPRKLNRSTSNSPKHSMAQESPGMKALMALSENLESSLNQRTSSGGNKPTISGMQNNGSAQQSRSGSPSSESLRKVALINNSSPLLTRRNAGENDATTPTNEELPDKQSIMRSKSELPPQTPSPMLIKKSNSEQNMYQSNNKRYTWHDFDSKSLLQKIQNAKNGSGDRNFESVPEEESRPFERTFSKSTEQLNSPKKQKSFKKSILKKFTTADSRIVERDESSVTSSSDTSMDSKQTKKQLEKDRKEEKKRMKVCLHCRNFYGFSDLKHLIEKEKYLCFFIFTNFCQKNYTFNELHVFNITLINLVGISDFSNLFVQKSCASALIFFPIFK